MPTHPASALTRSQRLQVSARFWLLGVLACLCLCSLYAGTARPATWRGTLFVYGGALSCAASLSCLPGLLCLAAAALVRSRLVLALVSAVLWTVALLLLYVDTRIYEIFRYHFNGLVWNVLTTPGADEAVHLSTREIALVLGLCAASVPLLYGIFVLLWNRAARRVHLGLPTPALARPELAWKLVLVPNMLMIAGVYAWSDMHRDPHVMAFSRVYPLYPRLTLKRFARQYLGVVMKERPEVDMPESGILLSYPHEMPRLRPDAPRSNVLVIVIDSLRADMLLPEIMPRTSALAAEGRVFRDHLSSGNATRFGVFGLIYGLHGSYWKPIYSEHRSPVLVDALLANGYEFRVLTSASMDFPEFRSTAWVRIEPQVEDRLPSTRPGGRDDGVAERFEEWLGERTPADTPFFAFALLDAPHQTYSFPEECALFEPYLDRVAYTSIDEDAPEHVRVGLWNRYRNAVHYADQITGRMLDALRARGLADDTLVVVTGDHGEEFFENGFWGHTSNFTREQVQVPFLLAGPGVPPGEETRPTSHIDMPATLLELLGADPAVRASWTLGGNLLAPEPSVRIVSGWSTLGMHVGNEILEVPMAGYGGTGIAVYDVRWQPSFDDEAILEREGKALGALALDCRFFMR